MKNIRSQIFGGVYEDVYPKMYLLFWSYINHYLWSIIRGKISDRIWNKIEWKIVERVSEDIK